MAKKAASRVKLFAINQPVSGSTVDVQSPVSTATVGKLCSADGTAFTEPTGFQLVGVYAYIVAGQDTPATLSDIQTYGLKISNGPALPWTANQILQAYLPSASNPQGWNTLHLLYCYFKPGMPPQGNQQTESVSFKGQYTAACGAMAGVGVKKVKAAAGGCGDILPTSRSGKTYTYRNVPVNCPDGVRLMHDKSTPLSAKLVAVAATKVDWTPNPLSEAKLHRPIGQLELYREGNWWEPHSRFRFMPRNAIVMFQPFSTAHTVMANSMKQPDVLEFFDPTLDLKVAVNDLVDPLGSTTDYFANNDGCFDLVVKVLKKS